jgi:hypothetical protein
MYQHGMKFPAYQCITIVYEKYINIAHLLSSSYRM